MFPIISTDAADFSNRWFFKIISFSAFLRQCFQITVISGNENHKSNDFFRFIFSIHSSLFMALRSSSSGVFWNSPRKAKRWSLCLLMLRVSATIRTFFLGFFWNFQNILLVRQLWTTGSKLFDIFSWNIPVILLSCPEPVNPLVPDVY